MPENDDIEDVVDGIIVPELMLDVVDMKLLVVDNGTLPLVPEVIVLPVGGISTARRACKSLRALALCC